MQAHAFECPNCGAPLDLPDQPAGTTFRCKFCDTSILVPRSAEDPLRISTRVSYSVHVPEPSQDTTLRDGDRFRRKMTFIGIIIVLVALAVIIPLALMSRDAANSFSDGDTVANSPRATASLPPSPTPTLTPTPQFAEQSLSFGEEGIAPGMLNDARSIAAGAEQIFVAEYSGGRVQVFDDTGKYLRQWRIGSDKDTIIAGLAADGDGRVFVAVDDSILVYDGATGKQQATFTNPAGGGFGDLAAGADGRLYAAWYEARFGMITSLAGHRDDLVIYNPDGSMDASLPGWISGQTGELALDTLVAVDGDGNIFALDAESVAISKFSSAGKFITRFGAPGDGAGGLGNHPSALAVDGQGRVYVGDGRMVHVFSGAGIALADFTVEGNPDAMTFDAQNRLWVVARSQVLRLELTKP